MTWKFWKREIKEDTQTTITVIKAPGSLQISVQAPTPEKALKLYKRLKKSEPK